MDPEKDIKTALKALRSVRLSDAEKNDTRDKLHEFISHHPIREITPPLERSPMFFFMRPAAVLTTGVVLFAGAGTVAAAEGALPGDALYPVKISINEEMRSALTFTPEAKAAWDLERAERRLSEASELAVRDRLSADARTRLSTQTAFHTLSAASHVKDILTEGDIQAEERARISTLSARIETIALARKQIVGETTAPTLALADTSRKKVVGVPQQTRTVVENAPAIETVTINTRERDAELYADEMANTAALEVAPMSASAPSPQDVSEDGAEEAALYEDVVPEEVPPTLETQEAELIEEVAALAAPQIQEESEAPQPDRTEVLALKTAVERRIEMAAKFLIRLEAFDRFETDELREELVRAKKIFRDASEALNEGDVRVAKELYTEALEIAVSAHAEFTQAKKEMRKEEPKATSVEPKEAEEPREAPIPEPVRDINTN